MTGPLLAIVVVPALVLGALFFLSRVGPGLETERPPLGLRQAGRGTLIANSLFLCILVSIGTDIVVALMVTFNTFVAPGFPWFIAPALALSIAVLRRSRRWYEPLPLVRPRAVALSVLVSVLLGTAISVAALLSMAIANGDAMTHGRIALPGDQYVHATATVRAAVSLTTPVMAALYEEAGVRGALQLTLQHVIGPRAAEILAGTVFLASHGIVIAKSPWEIPFLAFSAFVNGRLAAVTQRVGYPVVSHCLSNAILTVTYTALRGIH